MFSLNHWNFSRMTRLKGWKMLKSMKGTILIYLLLLSSGVFSEPVDYFFQDCMAEKIKKVSMEHLQNKIVLLGTQDQTFEMLQDPSFVSEPAKIQLIQWADFRLQCFKKVSRHLENHPDVKKEFDIFKLSGDELIIGLYQGNMTYGQFNTQSAQLSTDFKKVIEQAQQMIYLQNIEINQVQKRDRQEKEKQAQERIERKDADQKNKKQQACTSAQEGLEHYCHEAQFDRTDFFSAKNCEYYQKDVAAFCN